MYPKIWLIKGWVQSSIILLDYMGGWKCLQDDIDKNWVTMFDVLVVTILKKLLLSGNKFMFDAK